MDAVFKPDIISFSLVKDTFQSLGSKENKPFRIYIGAFGNRVESALRFTGKSNIFCFVIYGTAEIEDRLLEAGDSLYLRDCHRIEAESFGENCVLLVLEGKA